MTSFRDNLMAGAMACACLVAVSLTAQTATEPAPPVATNLSLNPLIPPPPGPPKSPVAHFRELLAMSPAERMRFLADRSPQDRRLILDKVNQYLALSPEQRALRLEVTELRWYLWPLMKLPATNRLARLEVIPADMRKMVEDRLRMWDILPPQFQRKLLENEDAARTLKELGGPTPIEQSPAFTNLPPARQVQLQTNIDRWRNLPEQERQEITVLFDDFFGLRAYEQQKVLRTLSGPEYQQLQKTLRTFQTLHPILRARCIHAFGEFASMSPDERAQFLHDAQRWEKLTPSEREAWKKLVEEASLQPMLPSMAPPVPPAPRSSLPRRPETATNGN